MIINLLKPVLVTSLFCICAYAQAQETRGFNQNASRSNHTRTSLTISPVFSNPVGNSADSLLFRGSGVGFRAGADYYFGRIGIGASSGFSTSGSDNDNLSKFITRSGIAQDQAIITKSRQQNIYLLLGPIVRFGNIVSIEAHAKAGLFVSNAGTVTISQKGAQRAAYRNEPTDKNTYAGFMTGLKVSYNKPAGAWSFGVAADYLQTKAVVNNYDARRNGGMEPLKMTGKIKDLLIGLTISYRINRCNDGINNTGNPQLRAQNNNTVRSNRTGH